MINVKRYAIKQVLEQSIIDKPILLPYTQEEMKELIFDFKKDDSGNEYYVFNNILYNVKSVIDFSNVNFDNVFLAGKDLSRTHGIKFNPQKIYKKSLKNTKLGPNVEVIGNDKVNQIDLFEGVTVDHTEFNGCKNVIINPQTIYEKDLQHTSLEGVTFNGSFDGVSIWYTSFSKSRGAKLDPKTIRNFEHASSYSDATLLDLPEERGGYGAINYNDLTKKREEYSEKLRELIKDQLPPPKIEEPKTEPPKQKRKWF